MALSLWKSAIFDWTVFGLFDLTAPKKHVTSSTRVEKQFSFSQSVSLLLLGIFTPAYETILKLKHFQELVKGIYLQSESSNRVAPFWGGGAAHFLIFWDGIGTMKIPVSLNHWEISSMLFGPWSGWIKAHSYGKNHCQFVFLWSGKNQTHTKYKGKKHTCL